MQFLIVICGIIFTSSAQVLIKKATVFKLLSLPWVLSIFLSLVLYASSFVLYYFALREMPISKVAPVMTVGVIVLTVTYGVLSGESLSAGNFMGLFLGAIAVLLILN